MTRQQKKDGLRKVTKLLLDQQVDDVMAQLLPDAKEEIQVREDGREAWEIAATNAGISCCPSSLWTLPSATAKTAARSTGPAGLPQDLPPFYKRHPGGWLEDTCEGSWWEEADPRFQRQLGLNRSASSNSDKHRPVAASFQSEDPQLQSELQDLRQRIDQQTVLLHRVLEQQRQYESNGEGALDGMDNRNKIAFNTAWSQRAALRDSLKGIETVGADCKKCINAAQGTVEEKARYISEHGHRPEGAIKEIGRTLDTQHKDIVDRINEFSQLLVDENAQQLLTLPEFVDPVRDLLMLRIQRATYFFDGPLKSMSLLRDVTGLLIEGILDHTYAVFAIGANVLDVL